MRWRTFVACSVLAAAGPAVFGQSPAGAPAAAPAPYPTALPILSAQADVHSGPSTTYYATSRLRYGDKVVVLGESKKQPGWLEILPPAGSYSWIDSRYVKLVPGVDKIGIVDAGDPKGTVPVMPGSIVQNKEPNVEIARVPTGTQVLLVDRVQSSNGATLYPIAPVATEVRFLPIDAVRPGSTAVAGQWHVPTYPVSNPGTGSNWQTGASASPAANPSALSQLHQLAEQALAAGNVDRARLLYVEALNQTADPAWRNYLQNQLVRLAPTSSWTPNSGSTSPAGNPVPSYPTASSPPANNPNVRPVGGEQSVRPPAGPAIGQKSWSDWGVLRTSTFTTREGMPMYVLENPTTRQTTLYVTTQPGMSLREYVGQMLTLYGTLAYRSDEYIRMQYMIAEQLATPPPRSGDVPR